MSVTEPIVPRVELIATVAPPVVMLLPDASFNCTVMVALEPPTLSELVELVTVEVDVEGIPPVTVKAAEVAELRPVEEKTRYWLTLDAPVYDKSDQLARPDTADRVVVPARPEPLCRETSIAAVDAVTVLS